MRRTAITRLDAQRVVPYDPDDHTLLERRGNLNVDIILEESRKVDVKWQFRTDYLEKGNGKPWGHILVEAITTITDDRIHFKTGKDVDLPPGVMAVIEGAFADEVLLPASAMARAMRLPGLLVSPVRLEPLVNSARADEEE